VIDLHCHILPGLDDGPANLDFSLAMARTAVAANVQIVAATPHVRSDYPGIDSGRITAATEALNARLDEENVPLRVLAAAEVAIPMLESLDEDELARLALGSGGVVLLECPYGNSPVDVEAAVAELGRRGYRTLLAHPERCPLFQNDIERLAAIVDAGTLCSITAASLVGSFGERVERFSYELLRRGLVHDVASDSHDHLHRPPGLGHAFEHADQAVPGVAAHASWFTVTAPVAILSGGELADPPRFEPARGSRFSRLRRRR
jgi:protein-tyrosine phosphatase